MPDCSWRCRAGRVDRRMGGRAVAASPATALALALAAGHLAAQTGTVTGRVTAAETGTPIVGAEVSVAGTGLGTRTAQEGRFTLLNVPAGPHDLRIPAIGYKLGTLRLTEIGRASCRESVSIPGRGGRFTKRHEYGRPPFP